MKGAQWIRPLGFALAAVALAAPVARGATTAALGAQTEAKGYIGIDNYLVQRGTLSKAEVARLGATTEAKGFLGLARVQTASTPVNVARLAAETEAKGYIGLSRYLVASAMPQPPSVSDGFAWGDAGIGAAVGGGVFLLLGVGGAVGVQRRRTLPGLS